MKMLKLKRGTRSKLGTPTASFHSGFTIVELLIVIVVISILAAMSVVSYNGIQNRAHNTAIQNDLTNMAKRVHFTAAETGQFIAGGGIASTGNSASFPGFTFSPTKGSYNTTGINLLYCTGVGATSQNKFAIFARSKSGESFRYASNSGISSMSNVQADWSRACGSITNHTYSYGYLNSNNTWMSWTNG